MAVTSIGYNPNLTAEQAKSIFAAHFSPRYAIEDWKGGWGIPRDFLIVKNAFIGVGVKLDQAQNDTKFVYAGWAPKYWARVLVQGLLQYVIWNGLTNEVKQFIETAPDFR
jgi:hypothetical protein